MAFRKISVIACLIALLLISPALATDDAHIAKADKAIARGLEYLKSKQGADGSWTPQVGPAVTAMVLNAMLSQPNGKAEDPAASKALAFIMGKVQPDGGIHGGILENYNTAISLSALAHVNNKPEVAAAIKKGQDFLRGLQWAGQKDAAGNAIDEKNRWYGGAGYGDEGRPDMSNTQTMIEGLHDSGLDCKDPAYQRALVFITRCQGTSANKEFGDKIVQDGGFIYATSKDKSKINELETKVGSSEDAKGNDLDDGTGIVKGEDGVSRLRTYGSQTYAGFKSYLYAQLDPKDARVTDAYKWIKAHYTVDENPGVGQQGYYYYAHVFSRALRAFGSPTIVTSDGKTHDWGNDLIDKLVSLQREDGSFVNEKDRWMEGDPKMVTALALLAMTHAAR